MGLAMMIIHWGIVIVDDRLETVACQGIPHSSREAIENE